MAGDNRRSPLAESDFTSRKSSRFSRMNEGWEYVRVPDPKKKSGYRNVGVYRGLYYAADMDRAERIRHRLKVTAFTLAGIAAFLLVSTLPLRFNSVWFVGIAQGLALVALAYVAVSLVIHLGAELEATAYAHKLASTGLVNAASVAAFLLCVCAAAGIVSLFMSGGALLEYAAGLVGFGFSAVCMACVRRAENAVRYVARKSEDAVPGI